MKNASADNPTLPGCWRAPDDATPARHWPSGRGEWRQSERAVAMFASSRSTAAAEPGSSMLIASLFHVRIFDGGRRAVEFLTSEYA